MGFHLLFYSENCLRFICKYSKYFRADLDLLDSIPFCELTIVNFFRKKHLLKAKSQSQQSSIMWVMCAFSVPLKLNQSSFCFFVFCRDIIREVFPQLVSVLPVLQQLLSAFVTTHWHHCCPERRLHATILPIISLSTVPPCGRRGTGLMGVTGAISATCRRTPVRGGWRNTTGPKCISSEIAIQE